MKYIHTITWNIYIQLHEIYTYNYMKYIHTITWNIYIQLHEIYTYNYMEYIHTITWNIYIQLHEIQTLNLLVIHSLLWRCVCTLNRLHAAYVHDQHTCLKKEILTPY